jgi:hypothetical protein
MFSSLFNCFEKHKQDIISSYPFGIVSFLIINLHFNDIMDLDSLDFEDFVDFFAEDLEHRTAPMSPQTRPWITCRMRTRIDRLANDMPLKNRPASRGRTPRVRGMEPPIMPSEHWLADESPCPFPEERLSNDTIMAHRLPKLASLRSLCTGQSSLQDEGLRNTPVLVPIFLARGTPPRASIVSKAATVTSRPWARTCRAETIGRVQLILPNCFLPTGSLLQICIQVVCLLGLILTLISS